MKGPTDLDREVKRKPRVTAARDKRFVGWDGEGCTVDGVHHYRLFGSSDGVRVVGESLTWADAFPAIMASDADALHVIFAGTYDLVMLIHTLPRDVCERILKGQPTYVGGYRIQFFRGKFLTIKERSTGQVRTLYDVFTFFGTSFVKACREYLGDSDVLAEIADMKLQRSTFTDVGEKVDRYMGQELALLVNLMHNLRDRLAMVGIHPMRWHGPGAVAATILRDRKVKHARGTYSESFRRVAESAYYGGRFEQFQRGHHDGPVYEYDIRSAYPAGMRHLPDLSALHWDHVQYPFRRGGGKVPIANGASSGEPFAPDGVGRPVSAFSLCRVCTHDISGEGAGPVPWRRSDGAILYPSRFVDGWYWGVELPSRLWPYIVEAYHPYGDGLHARPFAWVQTMYDQRAALKAAKKPEQLALKLGLNSLYGKLAQSKGARCEHGVWKYPTYHESVWAGWITAYTRAKLRYQLDRHYGSIVAVETDALFSTTPLPVRIGTGLGEWEEQRFEGIMYLQSGVYFIKDSEGWSMKSRGFAPRGHTPELWLSHMEGLPYGVDEGLAVSHNRFGTVPSHGTFARWYATDHTLRLDQSGSKREHIPANCFRCLDEERLSYARAAHVLSVPELEPQPCTPYPFPWTDPELAKRLSLEYELEDWMEPE